MTYTEASNTMVSWIDNNQVRKNDLYSFLQEYAKETTTPKGVDKRLQVIKVKSKYALVEYRATGEHTHFISTSKKKCLDLLVEYLLIDYATEGSHYPIIE